MKLEMIKFNDRFEWRLDEKLHRVDGPAIEWDDGDREWYLNGIRHRIGGPAVEFLSRKEWYLAGKRHRVDGSAVEWRNGDREWWLKGKPYENKETWFESLTKEEKLAYLFNMES